MNIFDRSPAVSGINHTDDEQAVVYGVYDAVIADTQVEQTTALFPLQPFDIAFIWQLADGA